MRYAVLKKLGRLPHRFRSHGGSVQDSSNATLEEVRNAKILGASKAAKPFYPSELSCSFSKQSLRASLDPARTYLQGGGYDLSRQCRADTQLAFTTFKSGLSARQLFTSLLSIAFNVAFFTSGIRAIRIVERRSPSSS